MKLVTSTFVVGMIAAVTGDFVLAAGLCLLGTALVSIEGSEGLRPRSVISKMARAAAARRGYRRKLCRMSRPPSVLTSLA
jgi:hypothetical protein